MLPSTHHSQGCVNPAALSTRLPTRGAINHAPIDTPLSRMCQTGITLNEAAINTTLSRMCQPGSTPNEAANSAGNHSQGCVKPATSSTLPIPSTQHSQGCVKPNRVPKQLPRATFMIHATMLIQGAWRRTINAILFMDEPRSNHISITNRQEVKDHRQLRYPNSVSYIKYLSTGLVTKSPKREFAFIIPRDAFVLIINQPSQTANMS